VKITSRGIRSRWRVKPGLVLWPLAAGLAFCALSVWAASTYVHNQAAFRANAIPASAVIDQIRAGTPYENQTGVSWDDYAHVHFQAQGGTAHALVLLDGRTYHAGQVITVYYSPHNLRYAQLSPSAKSSFTLDWGMILLFGLFGVVFLVAAVINLLSARIS